MCLEENDCKVTEPWGLRGSRDLGYLILQKWKRKEQRE